MVWVLAVALEISRHKRVTLIQYTTGVASMYGLC